MELQWKTFWIEYECNNNNNKNTYIHTQSEKDHQNLYCFHHQFAIVIEFLQWNDLDNQQTEGAMKTQHKNWKKKLFSLAEAFIN